MNKKNLKKNNISSLKNTERMVLYVILALQETGMEVTEDNLQEVVDYIESMYRKTLSRELGISK